MYRLYGHLSYIDKYNKLKFVWLDTDTKEKLERLCDGCTNKPFDDEGFTVTTGKEPTPDIIGKIGLDFNIWVKPQKYQFKSKLEHNKDQLVTGYTLLLKEI